MNMGLAQEAGQPLGKWLMGNTKFLAGYEALSFWGKFVMEEHQDRLVSQAKLWGNRLS